MMLRGELLNLSNLCHRQMAGFNQEYRDAHKEHISSLRALQRYASSLLPPFVREEGGVL